VLEIRKSKMAGLGEYSDWETYHYLPVPWLSQSNFHSRGPITHYRIMSWSAIPRNRTQH
jgi:hypothetical protein